MAHHLEPGMTLFDVGAEHGWMSLLGADMVGPENMVLIEPTDLFWPNIKATWERNYNTPPKGCFDVLVSDKTTKQGPRGCGWPAYSDGPLIDRNSYRYIWDNESDPVPEMTLDDLVERSGIVPDALTIDVEGAEHLVLNGATQTLLDHRPLVWISIHPDLMLKHYDALDSEVHEFMSVIGYHGQHLADDHESHWLFTP
jgi:FkbM family methyltransferase